jgi:hypothetical protein
VLNETELCSAGSVSPQPALTECALCLPGKFQGGTGQQLCDDCPKGAISAAEGSTSCGKAIEAHRLKLIVALLPDDSRFFSLQTELCSAGTAAEELASTSCADCLPGEYQGGTGQPSCLECPEGTISVAGASTACSLCSAGTIAANPGSTECEDCVPGRYQGGTGQWLCNNCSVGTTAVSPGQTACSLCSAGKIAAEAASVFCTE